MAINPETVDKVSKILENEIRREGIHWKEFIEYIREITMQYIKLL